MCTIPDSWQARGAGSRLVGRPSKWGSPVRHRPQRLAPLSLIHTVGANMPQEWRSEAAYAYLNLNDPHAGRTCVGVPAAKSRVSAPLSEGGP